MRLDRFMLDGSLTVIMTSIALRAIFVAALVLLAVPGTAAADCMDGAGELTSQDIQTIADAYNENADQLPGFIAGQFANQRVELRISGDTDIIYTIAFDDASRATSITEGAANPTLRVTVASTTLCDAAQSNNPAVALVTAYQNGDVDIEGVGTANSVKVTLVKTAISIGQFFGLF